MTIIAPRIVNNVSYAIRINHDSHFAWQVQYLVMMEDDNSCSAHCEYNVSYVTGINDESHFAWQVQYLVRLQGDICCTAHCK